MSVRQSSQVVGPGVTIGLRAIMFSLAMPNSSANAVLLDLHGHNRRLTERLQLGDRPGAAQDLLPHAGTLQLEGRQPRQCGGLLSLQLRQELLELVEHGMSSSPVRACDWP